jgi:hypothetical protein
MSLKRGFHFNDEDGFGGEHRGGHAKVPRVTVSPTARLSTISPNSPPGQKQFQRFHCLPHELSFHDFPPFDFPAHSLPSATVPAPSKQYEVYCSYRLKILAIINDDYVVNDTARVLLGHDGETNFNYPKELERLDGLMSQALRDSGKRIENYGRLAIGKVVIGIAGCAPTHECRIDQEGWPEVETKVRSLVEETDKLVEVTVRASYEEVKAGKVKVAEISAVPGRIVGEIESEAEAEQYTNTVLPLDHLRAQQIPSLRIPSRSREYPYSRPSQYPHPTRPSPQLHRQTYQTETAFQSFYGGSVHTHQSHTPFSFEFPPLSSPFGLLFNTQFGPSPFNTPFVPPPSLTHVASQSISIFPPGRLYSHRLNFDHLPPHPHHHPYQRHGSPYISHLHSRMEPFPLPFSSLGRSLQVGHNF